MSWVATLQVEQNGTETNACQLAEKHTTPDAVAAVFEAFTERLDPWGTVATMNDTFRQLECFAQAQTKLSPVKEPADKTSLPRAAVTRYLQVLADRLNASKIRLSMLDYIFDEAPSSSDPLSASLLSHEYG